MIFEHGRECLVVCAHVAAWCRLTLAQQAKAAYIGFKLLPPQASLSLSHTHAHTISHALTHAHELATWKVWQQQPRLSKKLPMQWNIEIWSNGHDKSRRFFPTHKKSLKSSKNWQKQTFSICSELKEKMCKAGTTREHQQELKFSLEKTISKPLCLALRW